LISQVGAGNGKEDCCLPVPVRAHILHLLIYLLPLALRLNLGLFFFLVEQA